MKYLVFVIFAFILQINSFGQTDSSRYHSANKLCIGLNIGGLFPFYKGSNDENSALSGVFSNNRKGFSLGLNFNLQSNRRKHFITQLDINYYFINQHIMYNTYHFTHGGITGNTGDFSFSNSNANISLIPEFVFGNKAKIYFGLGLYYQKNIYTDYNGRLGVVGMIQLPDSLAPHYTTDTIYYINNKIREVTNLNSNLGYVFNLGIEIPIKKEKLLIMTRFYRGIGNIFVSDLKQYIASISLTIPLNYK